VGIAEYQGFTVARDGDGVALITLTRPDRLNAMSFGTRRDLVEVLGDMQLDDRVRVVVITGTGRAFCAGMYLPQGDAAPEPPTLVPDRSEHVHRAPVNLAGQLRTYAHELIRTVRRLDKPTIAAVNGYAVQIGLSLALACDYVVAARTAKLGSATLRMGYQPDEGGHWLLVEHLGVKKAYDFVVRKRIVDAASAEQLGLVTEVAEDDELLDRALALARELAEGPQVAMRLLKRAIYNAPRQTYDQAAEDIAVRTAISDHHPDAIDGAKAWFRKEEPAFNAWLDE
jgi:2-(1,2-epoxy-1,2-dihydrophenyl)acetyl-CoA isomerase